VGSGARAQGKALAFIAVADDATAASHNPAGLVQLQWPEVSIVGSYFLRQEYQDVVMPDTHVADQTLEDLQLDYLSIVYPFGSKSYPGQAFNLNWVVSLNYQRLFDLRGDTDTTFGLQDIDAVQQVLSRQRGSLSAISPAVAVQLHSRFPWFSRFAVGVAFNIWPGLFDNGWKQEVSVSTQGSLASGNRIVDFTSEAKIHEQFRLEGFNYNVTVGFLWEIWRGKHGSNVSLGGVFRSPFTAKVRHTSWSSITIDFADGSGPLFQPRPIVETLDLEMPLSYGLGISVQIFDELTISLDVSRIHWSDFRLEEPQFDDRIVVENSAPSGRGTAVLNGASDNSTTVRLGAEYVWDRRQFLVPLRAGLFYDPEPSDRGTDDFFGFSVGSGLTTNTFIFDFAYTFRTGTIPSQATDTTVYQHELFASIIYRFDKQNTYRRHAYQEVKSF
jgi:long-subunit fatty acid transport protein